MKITTRKLPATDTKGERVKAFTPYDDSIIRPWRYELDTIPMHRAVAEELAGGPVELVDHNLRGYVFESER